MNHVAGFACFNDASVRDWQWHASPLAVTLLARKRVRQGDVPPLQAAYAGPFARLPRNALTRAALIALLLTAVITPLCVSILTALDITSLSFRAFMVMKAGYGAALALLASPPILRAALA